MNVLVTGAKGMVGTALCNNLKNIRDGKIKPDQKQQLRKYMNMIQVQRQKSWMNTAKSQILFLIWQV